MSEFPLVSVVIITHRRVNELKRAVQSVLDQDYPNIELIIVNDGSSDGTETYLEGLQEKNPEVRVFHHDTPQGACAARNTGIRAAHGEFVAGLDDDDEYFPHRISELAKAYDPRYAFVCSLNELDVDGARSVHWKPRKITMSMLMWYNVVDNQVFAPRSLFLEAGLFDVNLPSSQDYDMWVRLLEVASSDKILCVQKPLQRIYVEANRASVTSSDKKKRRGSWLFYKKHKVKMTRLQRAAFLYRLGSVQQKFGLVEPLKLGAKIGHALSIFQRIIAK